MGTDKVPQIKQGHVVFVGSKGSGKTSLYQCLKSPNPQVIDGPGCSLLVEDWRPFSNESPGKSHTDRLSSQLAFLTPCDQAFNPPFLGGKIIELAKFWFKNKRFEPSLSFSSKQVIVSHCV